MPMGELVVPFKLENPGTVCIELTPFSLDCFRGRTRPRKPTDFIQAVILTSCPQSLAQDLQAGSEGLQWFLLWHFPSLSPQLPLPAPHVLPCTGSFSMEEKAHEPLRRGVTNSSLPDVCDYIKWEDSLQEFLAENVHSLKLICTEKSGHSAHSWMNVARLFQVLILYITSSLEW